MYLFLVLGCAGAPPVDDTDTDTDTDTDADTDAETDTDTDTDTDADPPWIAVSSYFAGTVTLFEPVGATIVAVLDAPGAQTVTVAPDGAWIVCAEAVNEVRRFDPADLSVWDVLVTEDPDTAALEGGGLDGPTAAAFGPDGLLYVSSFNDDRVLRFTAEGVYLDTFVAAEDGGLDGPDISLVWGPDGDLYVPSWYGSAVIRYDGATGALVETVMSAADGLSAPRVLVFDDAGTLWATSNGNDQVLRRYADGTVGTFAEVRSAAGMAFDGPDTVLVASAATDAVRSYDRATGETLGLFTNDDSLDGLTAVTLLPAP